MPNTKKPTQKEKKNTKNPRDSKGSQVRAVKKAPTKKANPPKKTTPNKKTKEIVTQKLDDDSGRDIVGTMLLPPKVAIQIAEEVAKRVGNTVARRPRRKKTPNTFEGALFLDTSAIIDGRIFELIKIGAFYGTIVVLEGVLQELKNIADSKDDIKKERGRRALKNLDEIKKHKGVKITVAHVENKELVVDERLIDAAKKNKGRIVTCDFNLSKKAEISGVVSIDLYRMANILKTTAVPGEEFFVKVMQKGKGEAQGVGYLPDGTMIVVEKGEGQMGKTVLVTVSRIIQTEAGKIFFAKLKANAE